MPARFAFRLLNFLEIHAYIVPCGASGATLQTMDKFGEIYEKFKVQGRELADKIRELIHEGNVRRIIIKDERGHTFMEIPLTVATIGVVAAPVLAAVGAIATLVAHFEVVVERVASAAEAQGQTSAEKTDPQAS
jgi:hypothetical protein